MKLKSILYRVFVLGILVALLVACGSDDKDKDKNKDGNKNGDTNVEKPANNNDNEGNTDLGFDPDEEITLHFMAPWGDAQVDERFKNDFEKEYPNVTIELIPAWTNREELEKSYAKDIVPDLVLVLGDYQELDEMDILTPLDDMVEQSGLDLSVYRDGAIDAIRSRDPQGKDRLLGLPIEDIMFGLFYNKEVFDLFGVEYPTDGMTWEELIQLVPKVTGERNGTEYVGLPTHSWTQAFQQLSVTGTDPETGEVKFVSQPEFAKYFQLVEDLISIPGNIVKDPEKTDFKIGNVAMNLLTVSNIPNMAGEDSLDFNVAQFPSWADKPNVMPNNLPLTLAISPHSEHKEAAFKVLEFIATKDQQINMAKVGVAPVVDDADVIAQLRGDREDINVDGIYSGIPAEPAEYSTYGPDMIYYAANFLGTKTTDFIEAYQEGKAVDINTFLREMEEEYETIIEEREAQD